MAQGLDLSIIIITYNEEDKINTCLASLPPGAEVVVVDSFSQDRTVEKARAAGARVEQRAFQDYADQRNHALSLTTRNWVLWIDADEVVDPSLCQAIVNTVRSDSPAALAYRLRRNLIFMGRVMRFGKAVDHPTRLFRREGARFVGAVHESLQLPAGTTIHNLPGSLMHSSYDDLSDYFLRFNDYTTKVAANHFRQQRSGPGLLRHVLRPWWEFFERFFLRLGFLDGYPGYCYALTSSLYTFIKYAKLRELQHRALGKAE